MGKILCVGDNDVVRAPALAVILGKQIRRSGNIAEVISAGFNTSKGDAVVPFRLRNSLARHRYSQLHHYTPRQLNEEILSSASIIFTMNAMQKRRLVDEGMSLEGKVFTLPEYATNGLSSDLEIESPNDYVLDTEQPWTNSSDEHNHCASIAGRLPLFMSRMYLHFALPGYIDARDKTGKNALYDSMVRKIERYASLAIPRLSDEEIIIERHARY